MLLPKTFVRLISKSSLKTKNKYAILNEYAVLKFVVTLTSPHTFPSLFLHFSSTSLSGTIES